MVLIQFLRNADSLTEFFIEFLDFRTPFTMIICRDSSTAVANQIVVVDCSIFILHPRNQITKVSPLVSIFDFVSSLVH